MWINLSVVVHNCLMASWTVVASCRWVVNSKTCTNTKKQAVVRGTTNPAPCCHLANDNDLVTPVVWAMGGDSKQLDLRPADPLIRIDLKLNQVVPWSLHTFPENYMQIGPAVSHNVADKETTKKQRKRQKTIPRPLTGGGVIIHWTAKILGNAVWHKISSTASSFTKWKLIRIRRSQNHLITGYFICVRVCVCVEVNTCEEWRHERQIQRERRSSAPSLNAVRSCLTACIRQDQT